MSISTTEASDFRNALEKYAPDFELSLTSSTQDRLTEYYELVTKWNARLHLVAQVSADKFALRHVLESLLLLHELPESPNVVDVGSGAGLPIIPCLIARDDLSATLVEASQKKSVFLNEALKQLGVQTRTRVVPERFENISAPSAEFVTCRALERFVDKLPLMFQWSPTPSTLLLFGGENVLAEIARISLPETHRLIPHSTKRYLIRVEKN